MNRVKRNKKTKGNRNDKKTRKFYNNLNKNGFSGFFPGWDFYDGALWIFYQNKFLFYHCVCMYVSVNI